MKITLGRTAHGPFTISVSFTISRRIGAVSVWAEVVSTSFNPRINNNFENGEGGGGG